MACFGEVILSFVVSAALLLLAVIDNLSVASETPVSFVVAFPCSPTSDCEFSLALDSLLLSILLLAFVLLSLSGEVWGWASGFCEDWVWFDSPEGFASTSAKIYTDLVMNRV